MEGDLEGANIWMLNTLAQLGNFTIQYYLYKLPPSVLSSPDRSTAALYVLSKGFDCVTSSTQVDAALQAGANTLMPTESAGALPG